MSKTFVSFFRYYKKVNQNYIIMWNEIINKAKDNITGEIQNRAGINQQQADKSIDLAGESSREVLLDEAKQGNVQQIMSLFRGSKPGASGNPLVQKISNNLVGKLVSQLGLSPETAGTVETIAVPYLLNLVNQKTGGQDSAPSQQSLMSLLGGGSGGLASGVTDQLKKGLGGFFK